MSHTFRLNGRALNRGVDEVLLLKPLKRAVASLVTKQSAAKNNSCAERHTNVVTVKTSEKTRTAKNTRSKTAFDE
ncbi:MAG: hypothetical protein V7763_05560 [Sulfitobacter sp.]